MWDSRTSKFSQDPDLGVFRLRLHFILSMVLFASFGAGMIPLELHGKTSSLVPDWSLEIILRLRVRTMGTKAKAFLPLYPDCCMAS